MDLNKTENLFIKYIIDYLNINHKLINYYADISYDKSKIKDSLFVGFILNKDYYIIDSVDKTSDIKYNKINFINCSKDIINKIKSYRDLNKKNHVKLNKEYSIIYGIIDIDLKKNIKKFKIIDKSLEEDILTREKQKSKRSIITGRICSTFHMSKLFEIRKKINMYDINGKRRVDFICEDLEVYFRYKKLCNDDNKIWFEEIIQ